MASPRLLLPVAVCAGLILPTQAGAAEYCVATTTPCAVPLHNVATVQAALDAAAAFDGADTVRVGPGEFAGDVFLGGDDAVQLVGEGIGVTTLVGSGDTAIGGVGGGDVVRDLTIRAAAGDGRVATNIAGGTLRGVRVETRPEDSQTGVYANSGLIENSEIVTPIGRAVDVQGDTPRILGSRIAGRTYAFDQHFEAADTVFEEAGIELEGPNSRAELRNVVVAVDRSGTAGLSVSNGALTGHHVTVVHRGAPAAGVAGLHARPGGEISLDSAIVSGFPVSLRREEVDGPVGPTNLTVTNSSYAFGGVTETQGTNGGTLALGPGNVDAGGGFAGPEDLRLRGDAPQVDRGAATALSAADLGGFPRLADGDGDGAAVTDMGAYEYRRQAPAVTLAAPATARAGVPVAFTAAGTDADGEPLTYAWSFGATGAKATAALTAGARVVTVTATDPAGLTATASATVQVAAASAPGGGTTPPAGDTTAPALTGAALAKRRFARSRATVAPAAKGSLALTLSEPATVALRVQRKRGGRWVAARGKATLELAAGASRLRFRGGLGQRLKPGRHRLVLVATDAAGNRSAPVVLAFRVKRG